MGYADGFELGCKSKQKLWQIRGKISGSLLFSAAVILKALLGSKKGQ
jgi:hypothetical protein